MIPKAAVKKFLEAPRDDFRSWKQFTDDQLLEIYDQLPIDPPIYRRLRRHQKVCFLLGALYGRFAFFLDTGCVSGDTLIETAHGPQRIDVLTARGEPFNILSLTEAGTRYVQADAPFVKGVDDLYEVKLSCGRVFHVTAKHRFLTERGWTRCEQLQIGECLPVYDVSRPPSTLGSEVADAQSTYLLSSPSASVSSVVSIKYIRTDTYYDLHVPFYENYIANGLCHHNSGKTLLSIALARYFRRLKRVNRVLVCVPNRINLYEWRREIEKHSPGTSFAILAGSSEQKWRILEDSDALLNVVTYMGLVRMVGDLVARKPKRGQKRNKSNQVKPSLRLLKRLSAHIDGLVLDESTAVSNHASLPFRVCRQLAKDCHMLFDLTGTPFGRDPQPLWAQLYLVDGGQTLGPTLGLFREAFYTTSQNYWGGYEYAFKPNMSDKLNQLLAHRSIRYEADQADLPQVTRIIIEVPLPVDAEAHMIDLKKTLREAEGNYQEMKSSFLRARQLAAGFIGFKDDATGERAQFEFEDKPKLEALLDLIYSIREDYKIVVGYDFILSGQMISRALEEENIDHVLIAGGSKDPEAQLSRFVKDPKCRVFVLNTSGAFGLNLQMARYLIFYESPVPVILRKQMERRVERQGSAYHRVFLYDLVMKHTFDRRILQYHAEGKDLFEAIVEGRVSGFGI